MEEKNEIVAQSNNMNLVNEIEYSSKEVFCSLSGDTIEEKTKIFNAMSKCDFRVADKLNTPIQLKDVIIQRYTKVDEQTGEVQDKKRIILIDGEGTTYASASNGLFSSLMKLFAIIGMPHTWETPLPIKVIETETKNKTKTYEIQIIN